LCANFGVNQEERHVEAGNEPFLRSGVKLATDGEKLSLTDGNMTRKQLTLLIGFLMTLSFLAGTLLNRKVLAEPAITLQTSQSGILGIPKWDYVVVTSNPYTTNDLAVQMNRWGNQGFEVTEFQALAEQPGSVTLYVLMKRQRK
jgi:hypothetical protein